MLILLAKEDQYSLETEFLIVVCCLIGNKWQSKTLFLAICDPCSVIVQSDSVFDCRLSCVINERILWY